MSGGGTLSLTLRCRNDHVLLSVSDTGCGIPADHVPKLFTPFFSTKEVGEGTGLGLTVVHGIIEEHQGSITVDSETGTRNHVSHSPARTAGARRTFTTPWERAG